MFSFHKPKVYRSSQGCCICKAKSSSSRFTDSKKYEDDFIKCFVLKERRTGEICNACVLLVKRWKKLPVDTPRNWKHVVDARAGPGIKSLTKFRSKNKKKKDAQEKLDKIVKKKHVYQKRDREASPAMSDDLAEEYFNGSGSKHSSRAGSPEEESCETSSVERTMAMTLDYFNEKMICCGMIFKGKNGELMLNLVKPCSVSTAKRWLRPQLSKVPSKTPSEMTTKIPSETTMENPSETTMEIPSEMIVEMPMEVTMERTSEITLERTSERTLERTSEMTVPIQNSSGGSASTSPTHSSASTSPTHSVESMDSGYYGSSNLGVGESKSDKIIQNSVSGVKADQSQKCVQLKSIPAAEAVDMKSGLVPIPLVKPISFVAPTNLTLNSLSLNDSTSMPISQSNGMAIPSNPLVDFAMHAASRQPVAPLES